MKALIETITGEWQSTTKPKQPNHLHNLIAPSARIEACPLTSAFYNKKYFIYSTRYNKILKNLLCKFSPIFSQ